MSLEYYNNIGKHMIESWLTFWPKDANLYVYSEDILPIEHDRIKIIDINNIDEEYTKFQNSSFKLQRRSKTFAKKAWPIMQNLQDDEFDYLIWLDADVITEGEITYDFLNEMLPKNYFSCHIGVPQGPYYSVETGFFIINKKHNYKDKFLEIYRKIYITRNFSDMHKPFDGDVFGKVIRELKKYNDFAYKELNENYETSLSPFNHIFEGKMRHYKAKRKYGTIS